MGNNDTDVKLVDNYLRGETKVNDMINCLYGLLIGY
jgi:hypothetical protein